MNLYNKYNTLYHYFVLELHNVLYNLFFRFYLMSLDLHYLFYLKKFCLLQLFFYFVSNIFLNVSFIVHKKIIYDTIDITISFKK